VSKGLGNPLRNCWRGIGNLNINIFRSGLPIPSGHVLVGTEYPVEQLSEGYWITSRDNFKRVALLINKGTIFLPYI
jgi:hypothetical protein